MGEINLFAELCIVLRWFSSALLRGVSMVHGRGVVLVVVVAALVGVDVVALDVVEAEVVAAVPVVGVDVGHDVPQLGFVAALIAVTGT